MRHKLVSIKTGEEVHVGEVIPDGQGSYGRLLNTQPPSCYNPLGYIVVDESRRTVLFYPSAYGLEFISEPDLDDVEKLAGELKADLEESAKRLVS